MKTRRKCDAGTNHHWNCILLIPGVKHTASNRWLTLITIDNSPVWLPFRWWTSILLNPCLGVPMHCHIVSNTFTDECHSTKIFSHLAWLRPMHFIWMLNMNTGVVWGVTRILLISCSCQDLPQHIIGEISQSHSCAAHSSHWSSWCPLMRCSVSIFPGSVEESTMFSRNTSQWGREIDHHHWQAARETYFNVDEKCFHWHTHYTQVTR